MANSEFIIDRIKKSAEVKLQLAADKKMHQAMEDVADAMVSAFKNGGCVLFCGNGGSAADAQHISAELSGRFYTDREPLNAEALHVNTSYLTAVANDYSYDAVYSRLVKAKGKKGDVLVGISTSGNSKNVINALEIANKLGMITVGMTGKKGGKMKEKCKYLLNVPSDDTPRIQECHILVGHIICEMVENKFFHTI